MSDRRLWLSSGAVEPRAALTGVEALVDIAAPAELGEHTKALAEVGSHAATQLAQQGKSSGHELAIVGSQTAVGVASKGAVGALVEREVAGSVLPQLVVEDTRQALAQLGALNRNAFDKPLAAITGSSGKTTVKEILACILRTRGPVLATRGN